MKPLIRYKNKSLLVLTLLLLTSTLSWAQATLSGRVTDDKGKPLSGVSVSLINTIDGTTTDSTGNFKFTTDEKGAQTIVASEVGHENSGIPLTISGNITGIALKMKTAAHSLGQVTITAGSFEASNDKDKTVLKPLDIVTTAGANADVVKAMETLPGTQKTGTDNGLFVRGGDASEAAILVDEMVVQNAFFAGPPGVTTRSRFGAFQYQGVSFSSGGYSARYGQALSSVLELSSTDLPDKSNVNLGVNMAGVYASGTKLFKNNSSIDGGVNYTNLTPFYGLASSNIRFYDVPIGGGGNARYTWQPNKNGILKVAVNGTFFNSGIAIFNPYVNDTAAQDASFRNMGNTVNFKTSDINLYSNASYRQLFKNKFSLYTAASYSMDSTKNSFGIIPLTETDQRAQMRIEGKDFFTSRFNVLLGGEVQHYKIQKTYNVYTQSITENQLAAYTEAEWTPIYWLAFKPGLRLEHSEIVSQTALAPRFSMAIKTGDNSQVSLAGGIFYQNADYVYLLANYKPRFQEADHYIINYQYNKSDRTLRLEGYYKNYADLVRERFTSTTSFDPNNYRYILPSPGEVIDNSGYGYAEGAELFWRDKKSVKNLDYWISYSYIDTKRLYKNFLTSATPDFISDHNLNVVAKYFVEKWNTNFSATYSYASGRPYYNPAPGVAFMSDRTPPINNVALTVAYLHTFGKWFSVFYLSLDNITNAHNIYGYRYNVDGTNPQPIIPALYRSVFVGVNLSLTEFKKEEL